MFTFCNITFDLLNHLTPAAHARRGNHLPPLQFVVVSGRIPTSLALYSEHVTVPPFCKKTYTSSGRNFLLHPLRRTVAQVHHLQHSERSSPIKKDIEPRHIMQICSIQNTVGISGHYWTCANDGIIPTLLFHDFPFVDFLLLPDTHTHFSLPLRKFTTCLMRLAHSKILTP